MIVDAPVPPGRQQQPHAKSTISSGLKPGYSLAISGPAMVLNYLAGNMLV
jgi:hypothetical protein